ncbi:MAG: nickel-dependent hydrogenase large subunit [Methylobacillus sp.]|jgi:Ni,Fe-hydrogenase I large subunit|nr:nickel-dependent hydrogenase large subunit [Methylobacillus sp.]
MTDPGKLELSVVWNGETVRDATIKSTRPRADRILKGRTPEEAAKLVPMLFSLCGKAQGEAATAAMTVAQGGEPTQLPDRAVSCEAMQEHLWRLLLDWTALLGLPQQQAIFARWHTALNTLAAGAGDAKALSEDLHQTLTGMTHTAWAQLDSHAALLEWSKAGHGLCAPMIAALDAQESAREQDGGDLCELLAEKSAAETWRIGQFDAAFAAQPHYDGKPMETGALARWQHEPLLRDILQQRKSRLLARLVARLHDLLDSVEKLAREETAQRIQWFATETNSGLALVHTARGVLMHHARVERGYVAEYCIVAPTEWNFHPRGAWRAGLMNLRARDAAHVREAAQCLVLSLDPCVEYTLEVHHA